MTIATKLTLFRLVLIIPITLLLYSDLKIYMTASFVLFCIAIITDFFDGLLARKLGEETEFGGFLDAFTDKLLVYVLLFSFFKFDVIYSFLVIPMFIRDSIVDSMRNYFAFRDRTLSSNIWGKLKLFFQSLSIGSCFLYVLYGSQGGLSMKLANAFLMIALLISLPGFFTIVKKTVSHS